MDVGFGVLSAFGKVISGFMAKDNDYYAAYQIEKFAQRKGDLYDEQISFVKEKTRAETEDYNYMFDQFQSHAVASQGATGLELSGSALDALRQNVGTMSKDIRRIRDAGKWEVKNLMNDKKLTLEQAKTEADSLRRGGNAKLIGAVAGGGLGILDSLNLGGSGGNVEAGASFTNNAPTQYKGQGKSAAGFTPLSRRRF